MRDQRPEHAEGTGRTVQLESGSLGPQGLFAKITELQSQGSFLLRLSTALKQCGVSVSSAKGEGQQRDSRNRNPQGKGETTQDLCWF